VPANGTVIPSDSSVHYEVVTDRWNGNSASITYDVVTRFGDKVGEVGLHLSVPGSRWNSETRSCEVRGTVAPPMPTSSRSTRGTCGRDTPTETPGRRNPGGEAQPHVALCVATAQESGAQVMTSEGDGIPPSSLWSWAYR